MPFRAHLYSEQQIKRYIAYCKRARYSCIHIDATGGVLHQMSDQKRALLYAIVFKDGTDANDTVPLGHALLTTHTVPSIGFFFCNLAHSITEVEGKLILPSFIVIDFSAALMNAALQAFNYESINTHLNRCWNVLQSKYDARELRSLSFIHLCACHVIHAMARGLTAARVDKKIRRAVLHIFALVLCNNDIDILYDILGLVINMFGDPRAQNTQEQLDQMFARELNVDEESTSILKDGEQIFKEAKRRKYEFQLVDEYLRSNIPIIHQSPFNKEAIRRYPDLADLINSKTKYSKIVNPLFSPPIIRVFYRWWAYLPLWTGLLLNYEERYANDIQRNSSTLCEPSRYSNALVESYFRTFKKSSCQGKRNNRPGKLIMELHRIVKIQSKANQLGVTQSSKGRKRRKSTIIIEEKWGKKTGEKKPRTVYFNLIDKFASKRARTRTNENAVDTVTKKFR